MKPTPIRWRAIIARAMRDGIQPSEIDSIRLGWLMGVFEEESGTSSDTNVGYKGIFRVHWWKKFRHLHEDVREVAIAAEWERYNAGLPAGDE